MRNRRLGVLDPPFFTQKVHRLGPRSFHGVFVRRSWSSQKEYGTFLLQRLHATHCLLSDRGSLFFHCDRTQFISCDVLDDVSAANIFVRKSSGTIAGGRTLVEDSCRLIKRFSTTRRPISSPSTRRGPSIPLPLMSIRSFSADLATAPISRFTIATTTETWSPMAESEGSLSATCGTSPS